MKNLLEELHVDHAKPVKIEGKSTFIINSIEYSLPKMLKGKEKRLFNAYVNAYEEFSCLCSVADFKQGFKMGFDFAQELAEI